MKKNRRRNNVARKSNKLQIRIPKRVMQIAIAITVVALALLPLLAMTASAQGRVTMPQPRFEFVGNIVPQASVISSDKITGGNDQARFIFADASHGDGRDNGVFATFTVNNTQLVTFGILPNSAGTKFVSDFAVDGNQLHSLNYNSEWTVWDYDPVNIQLGRKAGSTFAVPANVGIMPLSKRSAVFPGFSGNIFTAKVTTAKGNVTMPPLDEHLRVGAYTQTIAFNDRYVYLYDPTEGVIVSYSRDKRGEIDQATKVLVAYNQYIAALSVLGDDLYAISRWFDADGNWHGQLIVMRNASAGNAPQEVLDNDVPADFYAWIGNGFAVADLNGVPVVALVNHVFTEYGPADEIIVWRPSTGWAKAVTGDLNPGAYITALRAVH